MPDKNEKLISIRLTSHASSTVVLASIKTASRSIISTSRRQRVVNAYMVLWHNVSVPLVDTDCQWFNHSSDSLFGANTTGDSLPPASDIEIAARWGLWVTCSIIAPCQVRPNFAQVRACIWSWGRSWGILRGFGSDSFFSFFEGSVSRAVDFYILEDPERQ